jgi:hypothetical protein
MSSRSSRNPLGLKAHVRIPSFEATVSVALTGGLLLLVLTTCQASQTTIKPSPPAFAGYHRNVVTNTQLLKLKGGSYVETVTVVTDFLRTKE